MSLPKLPEPSVYIGDDLIAFTEAQMLAFQKHTVGACARKVDEYMRAFYGTTYGEAKAIRAMLKEKTE
jgi:hypothetical protein